MRIIKESNQYYNYAFTFKFSMELLEFCRFIKNKFSWKEFNFYEKAWRFNNISIIETIKNRYPETEIDENIQDDWKEYLIKKVQEELIIEKANKIKTQTTSNLVIKGLKGNLRNYQKIGVEFFINNNGKAILADPMGVGKSIQALAYIIHKKLEKNLIICPISVKWSWFNEISKWSSLKPFVIDKNTECKNLNIFIDIIKNHQIVIINYDILHKFFNILNLIKWDSIIIDEMHRIKNATSRRTQLTMALAKKIPSIMLLSGTPVLNRPQELFNALHLMNPSVWNNRRQYEIYYCQGHQGYWGWDAKGSSHIDELQNKINQYFLRRDKKEILPELPPKNFIDIPVELSQEKRFEYDLVMSSFIEYLKEIKEKSNEEIDRSLRAKGLVQLGELRSVTSNGKIEVAKEIIEDIIDNEEKVVVFSCYNEPLKQLAEKFKDNSVMLIGETPEFIRKGVIEAFQNKPNVKIFFGGTKSAGEGITLTAASNILFIDYDWTPSSQEQAQDRCHRIGQEAKFLNIYQLYAKNTIDEYMKNLLNKKQEIIDKLINHQEITKLISTDIIKDLINTIRKEV